MSRNDPPSSLLLLLRATASAKDVGEIEALEINRHTLRSSTSAAGLRTISALLRARISLGRRRIDVVRVVADLVVHLTLLRIGQNIIRFGDLLELLFRPLVAGIDVRMVFARKFAERLPNLFGRGGLLHAQKLVVVLFSSCWHYQ